jgi:hypothetical protein
MQKQCCVTLAACIGLGADYHSAQAAVFARFESNIDECLISVLPVSIADTLAHVLAFCEQRHIQAGANAHTVEKQGVMQQSS